MVGIEVTAAPAVFEMSPGIDVGFGGLTFFGSGDWEFVGLTCSFSGSSVDADGWFEVYSEYGVREGSVSVPSPCLPSLGLDDLDVDPDVGVDDLLNDDSVFDNDSAFDTFAFGTSLLGCGSRVLFLPNLRRQPPEYQPPMVRL